MRASDRRRAAMRRNRQLGETEEQFQERNKLLLQNSTGLGVAITRTADGRYNVKGFQPHDNLQAMPIIRVTRPDLTTAARIFEDAATKLNEGAELVRKKLAAAELDADRQRDDR